MILLVPKLLNIYFAEHTNVMFFLCIHYVHTLRILNYIIITIITQMDSLYMFLNACVDFYVLFFENIIMFLVNIGNHLVV